MAIYKNANLDISVAAEQNPNYNAKPSVQFSTQDKNTAKYTFTVKQNNKPVDLTGVTASVTLFSEDKSVFQSDANITNAAEGKIEYVIPADAIRHHGKTRGDLRLTYPNGDVLGGLRFTFNIEQALIDRAAGVVGGVYIRDFETLKAEIQKTADSIKDIDVVRIDIKLNELEQRVEEGGVGVDEQARQEIQEVTAQLAEKANEDEVVKKGFGTLNDFDENTRAQIQGLEPGQINAVLGFRNVKPENTSFFTVGKNLFNINAVKDGYQISSSGVDIVNANFCISDYISVKNGDLIYVSYGGTKAVGFRIAVYDNNRAYLGLINSAADGVTVNFPNAAFVRASIPKTYVNNNFQIEKGAFTPYERFKEELKPEVLPKGTNTTVQEITAIQHPTDTRSVEIIRENGVVKEVREKDGSTIIRQTTFSYDVDGNVAAVNAKAGNKVVISTVQRSNGEITGITKGVTTNV